MILFSAPDLVPKLDISDICALGRHNTLVLRGTKGSLFCSLFDTIAV